MTAIAIDACWLAALDDDVPERLARVNIALRLREAGHVLLLDVAGHIVSEYDRTLQPGSLGRRFFTDAMGASRFEYCSGERERECEGELMRIGLDPSDRPYIGVAQTGDGIYLTTEVKHLREEVRRAVLEHCGVEILSFEEAERLCA